MMRKFKTWITANPTMYRFIIKLKGNGLADYFPDKETDLLISAYPRSGNDYAKQLAKHFFPGIRISSHFHRVGAFKYALHKGVPVIAIIREPLECVSSSMVKYRKELNLGDFPTSPMYDYLFFHKKLLKSIDQIHIVNFEDLVSNPIVFVNKLEDALKMKHDDSQEFSGVLRAIDEKLNDKNLICNQVADIKKGPDEKKEEIKQDAKKIILDNREFKKRADKLFSALLQYS
jgi:hypothetical protein